MCKEVLTSLVSDENIGKNFLFPLPEDFQNLSKSDKEKFLEEKYFKTLDDSGKLGMASQEFGIPIYNMPDQYDFFYHKLYSSNEGIELIDNDINQNFITQ
jgi:hypothetical protein